MQTENNFKKTSTSFFDKKDFVKMGGAVLITLLVVYLYNISQIVAPLAPPNPAHLISTNQLWDYYYQYPAAKRIPFLDTSNGGNTILNLDGFPIPTNELEDIIHKNKYSDPLKPNGRRITPDTILFYLGQNGTFDDNGQKQGNINIMAVGVIGSKLMVPTDSSDRNNAFKSSIYDKAMPCPGRGCPTKPPQLTSSEIPQPTGN